MRGLAWQALRRAGQLIDVLHEGGVCTQDAHALVVTLIGRCMEGRVAEKIGRVVHEAVVKAPCDEVWVILDGTQIDILVLAYPSMSSCDVAKTRLPFVFS